MTTALPLAVVPADGAPMSRKEMELRKRLVRVVLAGIGGALARLGGGGHSLRTLRDARLYRSTHKTFEDFCRDEFGLTRSSINLRVQAAEVFRNLVDAQNGKSDLPILPT